MYDFCFAPPYAVVLFFGALLGFLLQGSIVSLAAGTAAATVIGASTYVSFKWHTEKHLKCVPAVIGQLVVSLAVTGMLGKKFVAAPLDRIPQGFVAALSLGMSLYYVWNLVKIPTKPKEKTPAAKAAAASKAE